MSKSPKSHRPLTRIKMGGGDFDVIEISKEEDCVIFHDSVDNGYHPYGNDWWVNEKCPFSYKYISIDSMYPKRYFGDDIGHPDPKKAEDLYSYMQSVYKSIFGREFHSILELGTGGGEITQQFHKNGMDYIAVEGTRAGAQKLVDNGIDPERIVRCNLKFLHNLGRRFDIAMCTEVAEHIEPFFASKVVDNCIAHSDAVWFSAADRNRRPHYHHINEQDIEVWDNLFAHMGFPYSVHLNGMHERASRLYLSARVGDAFKAQALKKRD